jgi:hypothetical protein
MIHHVTDNRPLNPVQTIQKHCSIQAQLKLPSMTPLQMPAQLVTLWSQVHQYWM